MQKTKPPIEDRDRAIITRLVETYGAAAIIEERRNLEPRKKSGRPPHAAGNPDSVWIAVEIRRDRPDDQIMPVCKTLANELKLLGAGVVSASRLQTMYYASARRQEADPGHRERVCRLLADTRAHVVADPDAKVLPTLFRPDGAGSYYSPAIDRDAVRRSGARTVTLLLSGK